MMGDVLEQVTEAPSDLGAEYLGHKLPDLTARSLLSKGKVFSESDKLLGYFFSSKSPPVLLSLLSWPAEKFY